MADASVSEAKSFLLLIAAAGAVALGAWMSLGRHRETPAATQASAAGEARPTVAPATRGAATATRAARPMPRVPAEGVTRSGDSVVVRSGGAVARISRGFGSVSVQRYYDWESRRIATSVVRALANAEVAAGLGLTAEQLGQLRELGLAVSPAYTPAQTQKMVTAFVAWEAASAGQRAEAEKTLLAAVAEAGDTVEAQEPFSAKIAKVRTIVTPEQLEQLRFPRPRRPVTASAPAATTRDAAIGPATQSGASSQRSSP